MKLSIKTKALLVSCLWVILLISSLALSPGGGVIDCNCPCDTIAATE